MIVTTKFYLIYERPIKMFVILVTFCSEIETITSEGAYYINRYKFPGGPP